MKRKKLLLTSLGVAALITGGILFAADHIDSPSVTNQPADITDLYVFRGSDENNLVFVANTQGLMSPSASAGAKFDENTLIEFNIDNNNDNVEDLVIQCKYDAEGNVMQVYGPAMPDGTGTRSRLIGSSTLSVNVTPYGALSPSIATNTRGMKLFAGPRDDPFFFDLNQFKKILGGTATGFNNPGTDAFAGTNVMSVVVEVPKSLLGATGGSINVWVETKKKI
nr:DUF4331 family protein [Ferruginibacter lapsinanis]